jgi:hypothetical protein
MTIRIADLTVVDDVIEGVTFENCNIVGPAVIVFLGAVTMRHSGFDGDPEGTFWDTGEREHISGAVGLKDCTIVGCRFQRIGVAVRPGEKEHFLQGFGGDESDD